MKRPITLSVIKADIGGYVGHSAMHPALMDEAKRMLEESRQRGLVIDFHVTACGDDLELIMTHHLGVDHSEIHQMAWDVFKSGTEIAKRLKLYGAGQDLLADSFAGNVRGMGPGVAEMEINERESEPILIFMADKTSAGAWNMPLFKMFADPFNTAGLTIAASMHAGFQFEVHDVKEHKRIFFNTPEEMYDLLAFIGSPGRYVVKSVFTRSGEVGAVSSTQRLTLIAGKYVGKDDPVCVVRAQGNFPAVGEVLEPFSMPQIVEGWMRGSHHGPLMPVAVGQATPSRFDGPPRVIALGFQLAEGHLVGPRDMFDDPSYDEVRHQVNLLAEQLRRHGPFEPHRLPMDDMEYTTMPQVMEKVSERWQDLVEETESV
jgi:fructose 1,6-bisphosphate aldolase/phosphatase